jgi:O-antigen/teichoic acid export membrane protein
MLDDNKNIGRIKIVKDLKHYVSATIFGQGFSIIRSIFIPILFSPAQLGIWNLLNVLLGYFANAHLGLLHGMNKEIPFLREKKDYKNIDLIKDSVFWINLLLSIIVFLILLSASFFVDTTYRKYLFILSIAGFLQLIYVYYFSLLRADLKFDIVSKGVLGFSILTTFFILIITSFFSDKLLGAIFSLTISYLLIVIFWALKSNYNFKFKINIPVLKKVFLIGLPLIILGFMDSIVMSVDRWVIASKLTKVQLGYYAIAVMSCNLLALIPSSISSVLFPRMLEKYAVKNDARDLYSLVIEPMNLIAILMLLLICFSVVLLPLIINVFIHKYIPSIFIIEIFLFGSFFVAMSYLSGTFLICINKQGILIKIQIISAISILILDTIFLNLGYGLKGIAIGTIIGYAIYGISYSYAALFFISINKAKIFNILFKQLLPIIILAFVFFVLKSTIDFENNIKKQIINAALILFILLILVFLMLWCINLDGKLLTSIKKHIR